MSERIHDRFAIDGKIAAPDEALDVVIVGAGPAGLAAALAAANAGRQVTLIDEHPVPPSLAGTDVPLWFGGRATAALQAPERLLETLVANEPLIAECFEAGVDVRLGTMAWGLWRNRENTGALPRAMLAMADGEKSWTAGFDHLVLATGALLLAAVTCRLAVAETLLLLPHVGCQLESMSLWCVRSCVCVCASPVVFLLRRLPPRILSPTSILCRGTTSRRLIPIDTLAAVVINEAVTTTGVYFYLAIAQAGSLHLHLPFPQLRPRLAELVGPYRAARAMVPEHMPPWPSAAPPLSQSPGGALDGTLRLFTG